MSAGRIVLGLGGTVDHEIVWDLARIQALVERMNVTMLEVEDDPSTEVEDERGALLFLLRMMHRGRGGECHVRDPHALIAFDGFFESRTTLGGTCVRAAIAMERIGIFSTVHLVSISDEVRSLLPAKVERICSASRDSFEPHVILQFPAGATVRVEGGEVRSSRPNRVILVNDPPNEVMLLSPDLGRALEGAGAVLISGFNTMKSSSMLRKRIDELAEMLARVRVGVPIVYEDAGFHEESMRSIVLERIPELVDVHSLNEDEAVAYLGRAVDPNDSAELITAMIDLRSLLRARTLLLHTSHYAAVLGEDSERIVRGADAGCLMASTRFAFGDGFTHEDFEATRSTALDSIGLALANDEAVRANGVRIVPSYDVEAANPTTIGLGDSFVGGLMAALGAPEQIDPIVMRRYS